METGRVRTCRHVCNLTAPTGELNYSSSLSLFRSHGDMLYLVDNAGGVVADNTAQVAPPTSNPPVTGVKEDEVDQVLAKLDGKVYRKKDPQL